MPYQILTRELTKVDGTLEGLLDLNNYTRLPSVFKSAEEATLALRGLAEEIPSERVVHLFNESYAISKDRVIQFIRAVVV